MDTRQLEYILIIAEEKNLSRAADRLFLSQSALSQQLAKLEAEGLPPLFRREKGELHLTDAGKIYVNSARTVLQIKQEVGQELANLHTGNTRTLRLSISRWLQPRFYIDVLPALKSDYPETAFAVTALEAGTVRRALAENEIDFAVFEAVRGDNEALDYHILNRDELVLAWAKALQHEGLPLALPTPGTHLRRLCDRALQAGLAKRPVYAEVEPMAGSIGLALAGECLAVLPRCAAESQEHLAFAPLRPAFSFYTIAACRRGSPPLVLDTLQQLQAVFASDMASPSSGNGLN